MDRSAVLPEPLVPDVLTKPPRFERLHPNLSINFQLNRWLGWMTADAHDDVAAAAARAGGYEEFTGEFLALGDRLFAADRPLDAAFCYRAAEFFLPPGDQRKAPARRRFTETLRMLYQIRPEHTGAVPYQGGSLPTYRFGVPGKGTVVLFGGFDSYVEEFFPMMLAIARRGYQVIAFEGPGQGGALEDCGLHLTRDWQLPVGAVLDHFGLDQVTLLGISLGGGLAIRAAAGEPRIARVICDDILTDFLACNLRPFLAGERAVVKALLRLRAIRLLDVLLRRKMNKDPLAEWGITQGEHVLGVSSPYQYLASLALYVTADVSGRVRADALLLAGAEDHYVPLTQLTDQITTLTAARSVTARVFTRDEQAQNHVQVGNIALSVQVILDWLDSIGKRHSQPGPA